MAGLGQIASSHRFAVTVRLRCELDLRTYRANDSNQPFAVGKVELLHDRSWLTAGADVVQINGRKPPLKLRLERPVWMMQIEVSCTRFGSYAVERPAPDSKSWCQQLHFVRACLGCRFFCGCSAAIIAGDKAWS